MTGPGSIAAILLAAGRSRRFGTNKLLGLIAGEPMIARVTRVLIETKPCLRPLVVVTGYQQERLREALADCAVRFVHNPDYEQGLSSSLRAGIESLPTEVSGALVCLGDMPWVTSRHIERLIAAFDPGNGAAICVPVVAGRRGNPTLWAARFFSAMASGEGDVGARHLFSGYASQLREVSFADDAPILDVDTPEQFSSVSQREGGTP